ncbi:MAG: hypothetical protein IT384_01615 [Deltaproteobacteria bacterium]|nr:hypothetical protein [Deltaproteobacteria bacterium]
MKTTATKQRPLAQRLYNMPELKRLVNALPRALGYPAEGAIMILLVGLDTFDRATKRAK